MSMAVSDFGADWFLRVNVERVVQRFDGVPQVFFLYMYTNHNRFIINFEDFALRVLGLGF